MQLDQIARHLRQLTPINDAAMNEFLGFLTERRFAAREWLVREGDRCDEIFFINRGIARMVISDLEGREHTVHFTQENDWTCPYGSYLTHRPANKGIQALEDMECLVLPRRGLDWMYQNTDRGERVGRLIAEKYFLEFDERVASMYKYTPKERYDQISEVFPDIHNRAPQHMIASYLGISPVHLSRLKKQATA